MSKTRQVLKYLLLIAIVIALCRVTIFSLRFFLGSEFPLVVVEGKSMEPTFYDGDVLVLKGVEDKRSIKPPDIIVFYYEPYGKGKLIVHRVVEQKVLNDHIEFITKGDNNPPNVKEIVRETDVVGVIISKMPSAAGSVVMAIESPAVTIFTVTIIIFDIGVSIFYDESKKGRSGKTSL